MYLNTLIHSIGYLNTLMGIHLIPHMVIKLFSVIENGNVAYFALTHHEYT